jgi:uncharacterized damage-inducible protein DinB
MADYAKSIFTAAGRDSLQQMLDTQRSEISAVLDDLTEEEARARLVPSLTTPLGLVKHATFVEKVWFHSRVDRRARHKVGLPDTVDESFHLTEEDTIASVRAEFVEACARSRTIAAQHEDLEEQFPWRHGPVSLRFIYTHMIQEYARHAGHGDILVEQLQAVR